MIGIVARLTNATEAKRWAARMAENGNGMHARLVGLVGVYALRIEREAKMAIPVSTNVLRSSLHTVLRASGADVSATIGTNVPYAPHLEYGTGLWGPRHAKYVIEPRFKRALAWASPVGKEFRITASGQARMGRNLYRPMKGKRLTARGWDRSRVAADVVVRSVIHPGISPRPYLVPAFHRNLPRFQRALAKVVARFDPPT